MKLTTIFAGNLTEFLSIMMNFMYINVCCTTYTLCPPDKSAPLKYV